MEDTNKKNKQRKYPNEVTKTTQCKRKTKRQTTPHDPMEIQISYNGKCGNNLTRQNARYREKQIFIYPKTQKTITITQEQRVRITKRARERIYEKHKETLTKRQ